MTQVSIKLPLKYFKLTASPVKNVTRIFPYHRDGRLVENETKFDEDPIIFSANAMEMP